VRALSVLNWLFLGSSLFHRKYPQGMRGKVPAPLDGYCERYQECRNIRQVTTTCLLWVTNPTRSEYEGVFGVNAACCVSSERQVEKEIGGEARRSELGHEERRWFGSANEVRLLWLGWEGGWVEGSERGGRVGARVEARTEGVGVSA